MPKDSGLYKQNAVCGNQIMQRIWTILVLAFFVVEMSAQKQAGVRVNPEEVEVDMNNPTFVPMVRVGKVLEYDPNSLHYLIAADR